MSLVFQLNDVWNQDIHIYDDAKKIFYAKKRMVAILKLKLFELVLIIHIATFNH